MTCTLWFIFYLANYIVSSLFKFTGFMQLFVKAQLKQIASLLWKILKCLLPKQICL